MFSMLRAGNMNEINGKWPDFDDIEWPAFPKYFD
jgi:hypothetical protein